MQFRDELITHYAAKIDRFAHRQLRSRQDAEDLAQDIVLALCHTDFPARRIENMDAYIHGVCRYVLARHLRKRDREPERAGDDDLLALVPDDTDLEADYITAEQCARLRREVLYLSRTRREAVIGVYYDGQTGDAVASRLSIPAATVRWHLSRAKSELKERMIMPEQALYRPRRLHIGHAGTVASPTYDALARDLLMQNICRLCYDHPHSVEALARTLGVAAVYLEDKLEALAAMDYLTVTPSGKYLTNFVIHTAAYQLAEARYRLRETMPIARAYLAVVDEALDELWAVGHDGEVSRDLFRWDMLYYFMAREIGALCRLRKLAESDAIPSELDRLAIAELVEVGWAEHRDGSIVSRVPIFTHAQMAAIDAILARHSANLDRDAIDAVFRRYATVMRPHIPASIGENERAHHLTGYDPYNAIPYLLVREGLMPPVEPADRVPVCALVWDD